MSQQYRSISKDLAHACSTFFSSLADVEDNERKALSDEFISKIGIILQCYSAAIWMWNEEKQALQITSSAGISRNRAEITNMVAALSESKHDVTYTCYNTQRPQWYDMSLCEAHYEQQSVMRILGLESAYCAPITAGSTRIGVIAIYRPMNVLNPHELIEWVNLVAQMCGGAYYQYALLDNLKAANKKLQQQDRYKDEFLSAVSHELRTPLCIIRGHAEFLEDDMLDGKLTQTQSDNVGSIMHSVQAMMMLVDDLLDAASMAAGKFNTILEEGDYSDFVKDVVSGSRVLCEHKGLKLIVDVEEVPSIRFDVNRTRQILFNLISNAAKFTREGSVTVSVRDVDDSILTSITDTGPGISPKDVENIFKPFFRADNHLSRSTSGTGIGLHISRQLIELQGGKMGFKTSSDGTTFWFTIPYVQ